MHCLSASHGGFLKFGVLILWCWLADIVIFGQRRRLEATEHHLMIIKKHITWLVFGALVAAFQLFPPFLFHGAYTALIFTFLLLLGSFQTFNTS